MLAPDPPRANRRASTPLRLVVDTNVWVSALLHPGRTPDLALAAMRRRDDIMAYDARLIAEYREVLGRPKFANLDRVRVEAALQSFVDTGTMVTTTPYHGPMIDDDDRMLVEIALASNAHALVTGNTRHFPTGLRFDVLDPAAWLARYGEG